MAANLEKVDQLISLGELHLAVQALQVAVDLDPQPEALLKLARLQSRNPQWASRAIGSLRKAVALDPKNVDAWMELAEHWRLRGETERQRKALERVLAVDPYHDDAREVYRQSFGKRQLKRALDRFRA